MCVREGERDKERGKKREKEWGRESVCVWKEGVNVL